MIGKGKSKWFQRFLFGCGVVMTVLTVACLQWMRSHAPAPPSLATPTPAATSTTPANSVPSPYTATPQDAASPQYTATPQASLTPLPDIAELQLPPGLKLIIPVANIQPAQLRDTYTEARSEGRVHNAIDILAPQGTPVLAAADGQIVRFFNSERGGITLYQLSNDQRVVLYYAHLQRYAEGMAEGRPVRQGDTLAYVGDTGNAGAGNYHLHFGVWLITDPKRYWDGDNLNPYPLLKAGR